MMETGTETSALPVTETITTSPVPEIFIAQPAQKISNASIGDPGRNRTSDQQLRRLLL
jgi:hypothetical protein